MLAPTINKLPGLTVVNWIRHAHMARCSSEELPKIAAIRYYYYMAAICFTDLWSALSVRKVRWRVFKTIALNSIWPTINDLRRDREKLRDWRQSRTFLFEFWSMQRPPQKIYGFGLLFPVKVSHLIHTMLLSMYMEMVNSQIVGEIALAMFAPPFVYPLRGNWLETIGRKSAENFGGFLSKPIKMKIFMLVFLLEIIWVIFCSGKIGKSVFSIIELSGLKIYSG